MYVRRYLSKEKKKKISYCTNNGIKFRPNDKYMQILALPLPLAFQSIWKSKYLMIRYFEKKMHNYCPVMDGCLTTTQLSFYINANSSSILYIQSKQTQMPQLQTCVINRAAVNEQECVSWDLVKELKSVQSIIDYLRCLSDVPFVLLCLECTISHFDFVNVAIQRNKD